MQILRATTADEINEAIALAKVMHAEHPLYHHYSFDRDRLFALAEKALPVDSDFVLWLAKDEKGLVGFFFGGVVPYFFSSQRYAFDFGLFVHPDTRGGLAAWKLLDAFEAWAKDKKVDRVFLGVTVGVEGDPARRLYEKRGYTPSSTGHELLLEA